MVQAERGAMRREVTAGGLFCVRGAALTVPASRRRRDEQQRLQQLQRAECNAHVARSRAAGGSGVSNRDGEANAVRLPLLTPAHQH